MPNEVGIAGWDGIPIDRHQIVAGLTPGQLVSDAIADLSQGIHHLRAHHRPVGFLAFVLLSMAQKTGAFANCGDIVA